MIIKGSALSGQIRSPDPAIWCVLVFGDDDGVVSDTADQIAAGWSKSAGGQANVLTLDDDDVRRDPALLFNKVETSSLLGEVDIVRIRTSGEKVAKPILDLVEQADAAGAPFTNKLIVLNGTLNKRSKLRSGLESAKSAAAIHVFADSEQSMRDLVASRLEADAVAIETDALDRFTAQLPGHRGLANQETEKLALYGRNLGRAISVDDIRRLSLTDADSSLRDMIQHAFDGNGPACLLEYERVMEAGTSAISILRLIDMEAKRLLQARSLLGTGGNIGMKLKPPVWQSEWAAFRSRLDRWSAAALTRLLASLNDHELQAKESGPAADAAIRILLLNIVKSAAGRAKMTASR